MDAAIVRSLCLMLSYIDKHACRCNVNGKSCVNCVIDLLYACATIVTCASDAKLDDDDEEEEEKHENEDGMHNSNYALLVCMLIWPESTCFSATMSTQGEVGIDEKCAMSSRSNTDCDNEGPANSKSWCS